MSKSNIHKLPEQVVNTSLTKINLLKKSSDDFLARLETIQPPAIPGTKIDGKPLKKEIKRKYVFTGAGMEYICDFVESVCSMPKVIEKGYIDPHDNNYYVTRADWDFFKSQATANLYGQSDRLYKEIWRLMHEGHPVYIPKKNGGHKLMHPFIIVLETADKRELNAQTLQQMEQISQEKIGIITIYFAKELFQDFLEGKDRWFFKPSGFYALLYHYAKIEEEKFSVEMIDDLNQAGLFDNDETYKKALDFQKQIDTVDAASAEKTRRDDFQYIKKYKDLYYYLLKHDNGIGDYITVDCFDMLASVGPEYIDRQLYVRAVESGRFLQAAISVLNRIQNMPFHIEGLENHIEVREDKTPAKRNMIKFLIDRYYIPKEYQGQRHKDAKTGAWLQGGPTRASKPRRMRARGEKKINK
jgi:hypothetical protein